MVCYYVTCIRNEYARTQGILHQCLVIWILKSARSPKEKTKRIELILTLNRDLLGRLHSHHRRHNSTDQRAALTIQRFKRSDLLRIDIRRGRERVFFRSGALQCAQTAILQAVVVQRRNRQAEQRDKGT